MSDIHTDYKAFVAKLFNRTGDLSKDLSHAVLGIYTETHELLYPTDSTNVLEEAGDLTFFGVAASIVVNEALEETPCDYEAGREVKSKVMGDASVAPAHQIIENFTVRLADIAKRWVGYGKRPTPEQLIEARWLTYVIVNLVLGQSEAADLNDEAIARANMAKLLKRYPGGEFDAYRAINRDVGAERAAIESV